MSNLQLGELVWYEADDGSKHLMVVKALHGSYAAALYPHSDTHLMLENSSESVYNHVGSNKIKSATAVTPDTLFLASQVAKASVKAAVRIAEKKGHAFTYAQKNFLKQAVVLGYLQKKQDHLLLEKSGYFKT